MRILIRISMAICVAAGCASADADQIEITVYRSST